MLILSRLSQTQTAQACSTIFVTARPLPAPPTHATMFHQDTSNKLLYCYLFKIRIGNETAYLLPVTYSNYFPLFFYLIWVSMVPKDQNGSPQHVC